MSETQPSPEQLQNMMKKWQNWMGGIAARNKLVNSGNRLSNEGKVITPGDVVTNGPYVEIQGVNRRLYHDQGRIP